MHCCYLNVFSQCTSCTIIINGYDDSDYNLGPTQTLCITQTGFYRGDKIELNGGELCNMGFCKPKTVILNDGILNNYGDFLTANMSMTSSTVTLNNFGAYAVTSNFVMDAGKVNNDSMFSVTNALNIKGDEFNNSGELIIASDLECHALLTNDVGAFIEVGNNMVNSLNGTTRNSGCIEISEDFTNYSIIDDLGVGCGSFKVGGLTTNVGTFGQGGFVDICDEGLPLGGFDVMTGVLGVNVTICLCGIGTCLNTIGTFPIELSKFYIKNITRQGIDLNWVTQTELNNDYFTIQRSIDAISFNDLVNIKGAGTNYDISEYSWKDEDPLKGTSYYRLKFTDKDGNYSFSEILSAYLDYHSSILVYPNPVSNDVYVSIENNISEPVVVQLYNELGILMKESEESSNNIKFNINDVSPGMYILRVIMPENGIFSENIIKE